MDLARREEEIDLRELFLVVWESRWVIIAITTLAAIVSILIAISTPNIYQSEALLAPTSIEDGGSLGGLASQYGGLASFAGIDLGGLGGGTDKTTLGLEVLKSRKFVGEFVSRRGILPELMALESWKPAENKLTFDKSIYDAETGTWTREAGPLKPSKPSDLEAYKEFIKRLGVYQDSNTSLIRVNIKTLSPNLSKQWVDWLIEDINSEIKKQEVAEAEKSIAYLQEQLKATSLADFQTIFYQLIEEQTKTIMLANARPEYLLRTIDPAVIEEEPVEPKRILIVAFGVLLGAFISLIFVMGRHFFASGR